MSEFKYNDELLKKYYILAHPANNDFNKNHPNYETDRDLLFSKIGKKMDFNCVGLAISINRTKNLSASETIEYVKLAVSICSFIKTHPRHTMRKGIDAVIDMYIEMCDMGKDYRYDFIERLVYILPELIKEALECQA